MTVAVAHPNIALVKYWGKQPGSGNRPATPSLSITLAALTTRTTVQPAAADALRIDGAAVRNAKIERLAAAMRAHWDLPPLAIDTRSDFPMQAGLASSASGFAALVTAIDGAFGLGLDAAGRADWARRGSASAARSVFGGFATLDAGPHSAAAQLLDGGAWPLDVLVAVASRQPKRVPSTQGMERSRATSPYYAAWVEAAAADFAAARSAVQARDFDALAAVAEHSSMKLHALMLSTRPPLLYWNEVTVALLHRVQALRETGVPVFATIDAGPQVKAICAPGCMDAVAAELAAVPGVLEVIRSGLGDGARLADPA